MLGNSGILVVLTSSVNLVFLICSLWFGLFILTRNLKSKVAWLTSAILFSLSGTFLNTLTFIHVPPEGGHLPWWWGWSIALTAPLWVHLSVVLLPKGRADRLRTLVSLFYIVALNIIAMEVYTPLIFEESGDISSITYVGQRVGPLYPLYGVFLIGLPILALFNLRQSQRLSSASMKRIFINLQIASGLAVLGAVYGVLSTWQAWGTPTVITTLVLGSGILLLGYGIMRWTEMTTGRLLKRDFTYASCAIGLVTLAYLAIAWVSDQAFDVPFIAFIFLIVFAIISHSLFDYGRSRLERYFPDRREHQALRRQLKTLAHDAHPEQDLRESLQFLLQSLCRTLGNQPGRILLRVGDVFELVAVEGVKPGPLKLSKSTLHTKEMIIHTDERGSLELRTLISPLVYRSVHYGALVLGTTADSNTFNDEELDLVEDFSDRIAAILHTTMLQKEGMLEIESLTEQFRRRELELQAHIRAVLSSPTDRIQGRLYKWVEDALRHMDDFSYLGQHQLANLKLVASSDDEVDIERATHLELGKALHQLLVDCITKLKPAGRRSDPPSPDWRSFIILNDCYIEGKPTREVMANLYISEATFHRARRRAIRGLTRALSEMEQKASFG